MQDVSRIEHEVAELHDMYADGLLRFAAALSVRDEICRDAVQEAFLRYFVERRYGRIIESPRPWLYKVVRNYLLDRVKSAACRYEVAIEGLEHLYSRDVNPEDAVCQSETARQIAAALTIRELECLRLRSDGLSHDEIADVLGIRAGTTRATLAHVNTKLRRLGNDGGKHWTFGAVKGALQRLMGEVLPDPS